MLPSEILIMIFSNLNVDDLENARQTCSRWKHLISSSIHLWKCLIQKFCDKNVPLKKLLQMSIYSDISNNATKLEIFFKKLLKVDENVLSNNYRVRTLNCLEAEIDGKRVEKDSEWNRNYNYKGVYDMVLNKNILVASVYDTIQVWDMSKYKISNILPSKLLDEPLSKTTCFALLDDKFLVCGTQNGFLKLFSLTSGEMLCKSKVNSNYIADVTVDGDDIASVDTYGDVILWKLSQDSGTNSYQLSNKTSEKRFLVPHILAGREVERLMDSSSNFLVTTFRSHMTCYHKCEFFRSFPAPTDVFCISIQEDKLAFGCKGDNNSSSAGILNLDPNKFPSLIYIRTRDNDPIISISFNNKTLILGDTNGELHIVNVSNLVFPDRGEVTVELGDNENSHGIKFVSTIRTHEYRAFIWACKTDSYRVFSGDETGKIIIHDYLMFED